MGLISLRSIRSFNLLKPLIRGIYLLYPLVKVRGGSRGLNPLLCFRPLRLEPEHTLLNVGPTLLYSVLDKIIR